MKNNIKNKGVKFGEGQPTDRGGAPKGKRVSTILREILSGDAKDISKHLPKDMDGNKALALELLSIAFSKESKPSEKMSAIKEILDRLEGKPQQSIDHTSNGEEVSKNKIDIAMLSSEARAEIARLSEYYVPIPGEDEEE